MWRVERGESESHGRQSPGFSRWGEVGRVTPCLVLTGVLLPPADGILLYTPGYTWPHLSYLQVGDARQPAGGTPAQVG